MQMMSDQQGFWVCEQQAGHTHLRTLDDAVAQQHIVDALENTLWRSRNLPPCCSSLIATCHVATSFSNGDLAAEATQCRDPYHGKPMAGRQLWCAVSLCVADTLIRHVGQKKTGNSGSGSTDDAGRLAGTFLSHRMVHYRQRRHRLRGCRRHSHGCDGRECNREKAASHVFRQVKRGVWLFSVLTSCCTCIRTACMSDCWHCSLRTRTAQSARCQHTPRPCAEDNPDQLFLSEV